MSDRKDNITITKIGSGNWEVTINKVDGSSIISDFPYVKPYASDANYTGSGIVMINGMQGISGANGIVGVI